MWNLRICLFLTLLVASAPAFGVELPSCLRAIADQTGALAHHFSGSQTTVLFADVPVSAASLYGAHRTGFLPERGGVWEIPDPRGVIVLGDHSIAKTRRADIARVLEREPALRISFNEVPERVIAECARMPRTSEPWMTPDVVEGYQALARLGFAFSAEAWDGRGNLVAGSFGLVSNGHVQSMSKFRDLSHPLAEVGIGNLLSEATYHYFWTRGIDVLDVEVAAVKGGTSKMGVSELPAADFLRLLDLQNVRNIAVFEGAIEGQRFPAVQSDFLEKFLEMRRRKNFRFQR